MPFIQNTPPPDIEAQQPVDLVNDDDDWERVVRTAKIALCKIGVLTITFGLSSITLMALTISTEADCGDKSEKIAFWSAMSTSIITGAFCCSNVWKGVKSIRSHMDS